MFLLERKFKTINTILILKKMQNSHMSSKRAMKLAQKHAFAKHRSNITNTRFGSKKLDLSNKVNKKNKKS